MIELISLRGIAEIPRGLISAGAFFFELADEVVRLFTQGRVLAVCDLTLQAQEQARPWGTP